MGKGFTPSEVGDAINSLIETGVRADEIVSGALVNALRLASPAADGRTTTARVTVDPDAVRKILDDYVTNLRKAEQEGQA